MTDGASNPRILRPVILAGGVGSRLRPRTLHVPKPLLPIDGRPILWYSLNAARAASANPPIVCVDYLSDLIVSYFDGWPAEFRCYQGATMAEAVLRVAETTPCDAILGMSADVLLGRGAVNETISAHDSFGGADTVVLTRLTAPGHKRWRFDVEDRRLVDITQVSEQTDVERLLLILRKDSLLRVRDYLGAAVAEDTLSTAMSGFQTGWILLLRAMIALGIPVRVATTSTPVCNINVPADFAAAEAFLRLNMPVATTAVVAK